MCRSQKSLMLLSTTPVWLWGDFHPGVQHYGSVRDIGDHLPPKPVPTSAATRPKQLSNLPEETDDGNKQASAARAPRMQFFSSTAFRAANDGWRFCSRGPIRWCVGFGAATFVWKRYRQFFFRKKTQLLIFCVLFVTGFLQVGDTNPWSFCRRFVYSNPC